MNACCSIFVLCTEKAPQANIRGAFSAAGLGLEPRLPGPEPGVLPLDDPANRTIILILQ